MSEKLGYQLGFIYDEYRTMLRQLTAPAEYSVIEHCTGYVLVFEVLQEWITETVQLPLTLSLARKLVESHTRVKSFLGEWSGMYLYMSFHTYIDLCIHPYHYFFDDDEDTRAIASYLAKGVIE